MDIELSSLREVFFQEVAERIAEMESALLGLADRFAGPEALQAIFRSAHSIKAGAATFGYDSITRFTHELESLLDRMRSSEIVSTEALVELLLRSIDMLKELFDNVTRNQPNAVPEGMEALLEQLSLARTGGEAGSTGEPGEARTPAIENQYMVRFEPTSDLFRLGLDPFLVLRDLANLGRVLEVEADLSRLPALDALDVETCYLGWRLRLGTEAKLREIRDVFAFVEDVAHVSIERLATDPVHSWSAATPPLRRRIRSPFLLRRASRIIGDANPLSVSQRKRWTSLSIWWANW
jgi:two-component system chemotaxis sensor kinase CheA